MPRKKSTTPATPRVDIGQKDTKGDRRKRKGKRSVNKSTTSPKSIKFRKQAAEAVEYRVMGYTFAEIGEAMKFDASYAFRLVDWAMKETIEEPVKRLRDIMRRRLEKMQTGVLDKAFEGEVDAQDQVRRNMELQAKLDGLFAPNKVEHSGEVAGGGTAVFVISEADAKL